MNYDDDEEDKQTTSISSKGFDKHVKLVKHSTRERHSFAPELIDKSSIKERSRTHVREHRKEHSSHHHRHHPGSSSKDHYHRHRHEKDKSPSHRRRIVHSHPYDRVSHHCEHSSKFNTKHKDSSNKHSKKRSRSRSREPRSYSNRNRSKSPKRKNESLKLSSVEKVTNHRTDTKLIKLENSIDNNPNIVVKTDLTNTSIVSVTEQKFPIIPMLYNEKIMVNQVKTAATKEEKRKLLWGDKKVD